MKTKLKYFTISGGMLFSISLSAQMTLTGELRSRTEYRHGYRTLIDSAQNAALFTSQRTRLNFGYGAEKFKTGVVLQDVRVWGSQSQQNVTDGLTSIHEAWGEYWFNKNFGFKSGRQEIGYDDERILGFVGWAQQGRSHDAVVLKYQDSTFTAHLGAAYNQNAESNIATSYTVASSYKELYYLWLNKKVKSFSASVLALANGMQSPVVVNSTRFSGTVGTHLEYKKDALFAGGRFYYQTGVDGSKKDIQANMIGVDASYTLNKKFTIGLGTELLSGQSQTDTTKTYKDVVHNFNPLYGTGHKFNGFIDYFYAGSGHANVGLTDAYLKLKYKAEKWWVGLDVHQFISGADILDVKGLTTNGKYTAMNNSLGTEIDLTYVYNFNANFSTTIGYSHMLATESMEAIKGGKYDETQNWAYLMLTFKPNFLK
ncbi:MAG: hypothetical protein EPN85_14260 [Bacteroidetes bacterium]|nr:MAG: hypothetical protein EPN85_14260 [Bacteroidota bacterium]